MIRKKKLKVKTILKILVVIFSIVVFSKVSQDTQVSFQKLNKGIQPQSSVNQNAASAEMGGGKGGNGFTAGPGPLDTMYHYVPDGYTYCAAYNWQIARKEQNTENSSLFVKGGISGSDQVTEYELKKTTDLPQSVAFARYYYGSGYESSIQNLIWASNDWKSHLTNKETGLAGGTQAVGPYKAGNGDIYGRSYKFAEFVYNALDSSEKLNLQGDPLSDTDDRLRIVVNQDDDTYTVGPYKIWFSNYRGSLDHGGYNSLGQLVWDEITTNYIGKFVTGKVTANVTFQDNSSLTANIGQIDVLDEGGNVISQGFPEFGKTFYIRYHTSKNAAIVEKIKPIIEINYTKKFGSATSSSLAKAFTYGSSHVSYTMDKSSNRSPLRCCVDPYYNRHMHRYLRYGGTGLTPQLLRWSGPNDIVVRLSQKWDGSVAPDPGEEQEPQYKYYQITRYNNISGGVTETEVWMEISKGDYEAMGSSKYTFYRT